MSPTERVSFGFPVNPETKPSGDGASARAA